jgi:hypothetical protein
MFKISSRQIELIRSNALMSFEVRLVDFLLANSESARTKFSLNIREFVREQCSQAISHGLITERQIARYVFAAWLGGKEFDVSVEPIRDLLKNTRKSPEYKSKHIARWARKKFGDRD